MSSNPAEIKKIEEIYEYLTWVDYISEAKEVLFRGQPIDRPLLPRIARLNLGDALLDTEEKLFRQFVRQYSAFERILPERKLERLAVARHHGLPTRLLDWTSNPLVALWFAIRERPAPEKYAVVWSLCVEPNESIPFLVETPERLPAISSRFL
ncbi:MAG: FRG domain-containing protein [Candidatus Omnitrophica bacterium]|nr:FRG domain-containing protein [Candidatus Omnitrophota bacterium]